MPKLKSMQKQYNQTLFVEVPKDATEIEVALQELMPPNLNQILFWSTYKGMPSLEVIDIPSGEWEIVNPLNEITEEQAKAFFDTA